jgi:hypothetical protein
MRGVGISAAALLVLVVALSGCVALLWRWWQGPAVVADHAAPLTASAALNFAGTRTLAQRVRPQRDGLTRVDVPLAAESGQLPGDVVLTVEELPSRRPLRTAQVPAAGLPVGSPWTVRTGQAGERWTLFVFEPIPDSAGRDLLLVLSYPTGADAADRRVGTLSHLPARYPWGGLLMSGDPINGNLLFRLGVQGTRGVALWAAGDNLAREIPFTPGSLAAPLLLGALAAGLAAASALHLLRAGA